MINLNNSFVSYWIGVFPKILLFDGSQIKILGD